MAFNPDKFGFDIEPTSKGLEHFIDRDYVRITRKNGAVSAITLCLCDETASLAEILADGKRNVDIRMNSKGQFLICDAKPRRRLSRQKSKKAAISISCFKEHVFNCHGSDWERLYLDSKPYAGGEAILLVPNGERDI